MLRWRWRRAAPFTQHTPGATLAHCVYSLSLSLSLYRGLIPYHEEGRKYSDKRRRKKKRKKLTNDERQRKTFQAAPTTTTTAAAVIHSVCTWETLWVMLDGAAAKQQQQTLGRERERKAAFCLVSVTQTADIDIFSLCILSLEEESSLVCLFDIQRVEWLDDRIGNSKQQHQQRERERKQKTTPEKFLFLGI